MYAATRCGVARLPVDLHRKNVRGHLMIGPRVVPPVPPSTPNGLPTDTVPAPGSSRAAL